VRTEFNCEPVKGVRALGVLLRDTDRELLTRRFFKDDFRVFLPKVPLEEIDMGVADLFFTFLGFVDFATVFGLLTFFKLVPIERDRETEREGV